MPYIPESRRIIDEFRDRLITEEKAEFLLLAKNWNLIASTLENNIKSLSELKDLSRNQLYQLGVYKNFLNKAREQISKYSSETASIIEDYQFKFAGYGIGSVQQVLNLFGINFYELPINTINDFIGHSQEGGTLYSLLQKSYPETVTRLTNTLLESIALGRNPVETARLMKADMDGNLVRALRIARTEQLFIFRKSSLEQMKSSNVVSQWEWLSESDACDFCLEQNGKRFSLDEFMDTHPNCRCAMVPIVS